MNIVLVSSDGQCGIYEYSQILLSGFAEAGHRASYLGVRNRDDADLFRRMRQIGPDVDAVIFEYEPGVFRLRGIVRAMARLRLVRRKRVMLSVHEIEPAKYSHFHNIQWRLGQPARFSGPLELLRLVGASADVALHYLAMRFFLALLGWLPHVICVHSPKAQDNIRLAVADLHKVVYIPHVVKTSDGDPSGLRAQLGLPADRFLFISPGFLFRRKRIIETIQQLPEEAGLLVVGLPSQYDPGYLEEIQSYLASHPNPAVRLIQDYDNMERYVTAADAAVLYYQDAYQSGIAALALGAGKPCIFSSLPAFADYREAGLFVRTPGELRRAMQEIQNRATYSRLRMGALRLRDQLGPPLIAQQYANALNGSM